MSTPLLFARIAKVTEQSDGTLIVEGIASSETVDAQGEIVKADAMRAALPGYMEFPALREMHTTWAAGKTLAASVGDDGQTYIVTNVVDAEAIKKVKKGVYAGFSIGGSVPPGGRSKDNPKVIEQVDLVEISLVDRPANPDAVISVWKRAPDSAPDAAPAAAPPLQTSAEAPAPIAKIEQPAAAAQPMKKGMYSIAVAAELLSNIAALQQDTAWEAAVEGDGSDLPAKLKALASQFADVLRQMVGEETAELVAALPDAATPVAMAEKTGDVAKAAEPPAAAEPVEKKGAKYSAATKSAMAAHHDQLGKCIGALQKCHADFGSMGWEQKDDSGDMSAAAATGDLAKVDALEKRATEAEAATALAGEALKKVIGERDEVQKALDVAKAELAAARSALETKGALKVVPVSKGADTGRVQQAEASEDPVALVKSIHAQGGLRFTGR